MDPTPMLVVGAQGAVGSQLVSLLLARGHKVHAAVAGGPAGAEATGVKTVHLDPADGAATAAAIGRVQAVAIAAVADGEPATAALEGVVAAAARGGVKVVLLSRQGAAEAGDTALASLERRLQGGGGAHVLLRCSWLMDDFHTLWREALSQRAELAVPAAEGRAAFVAASDVAAAAAAALSERRWDGRALSLTGEAALTFGEAVAAIGAAAGRRLAYRDLPPAAFGQEAAAGGLSAARRRDLEGRFAALRAGHLAAAEGGIAELTGARPQALADYAALNAKAWRPPAADAP